MLVSSRSVKAILGASTIGALALSDPTFAAAQTFLGNAANNDYGGQLQVAITVDNGKITAITTPVTPGGRNAQYANYAVPTLTQEALAAQSANIQGVSGASAISRAWKQSLTSAIAKAGNAIGTQEVTPAPIASTTPAPTKTIAPAPVVTRAPLSGGENEGGEGSDDGYRTPRPERSRIVVPIIPRATVKPAPVVTPTSTSLGLTMGAGVIKKTITCVKGKARKTVKSTNPKCPTGYTLKNK